MIKKSSKFLFFDLETSGHHIEYLYHLIKYRVNHTQCADFVLLVHPGALMLLSNLGLPENYDKKGVTIIHPSQHEMSHLSKIRSVYQRAQVEFKILKKYIKDHQADKCYLMSLNKFQFALGGRNKSSLPCGIRGILFNPFGALGNREPTWFTNLRKHLQLLWMLRNRNLEHIYILNDEKLAIESNIKYRKKNLFVSLPDPILIPPNGNKNNISINISDRSGKYRFLMFGALSTRKGIFLVLEAIGLIPEDISAGIEFVFAGKISYKEREYFLSALSDIKNSKPGMTIHYLDNFVPYNALPKLFSSSDCVLVPYFGTQASSGVIGHAALYGKPVIGPNRGLIGDLIRSYNLGITIDAMNAKKLADIICHFSNKNGHYQKTTGMQRFVKERHPNFFIKNLTAE